MNNQKIDIAKSCAVNNFKNEQLSIAPLRSVFSALLMIFLTALISQVNAYELKTTLSSISYGTLSETIKDDMRANILKQSYASVGSDQATGQTRDEIRKIQQSKAISQITTKTGSLTLSMSSYAPEFTIYNAFATLLDDFDNDGYYQTFSVVFDADIYSYDSSDISEVYARLYLSKNGGPWIHYYTTDNFIIHSDSDEDEYEVITTLLEGYPPEHYDLLIDLYQAGSGHIVATYSSDDNHTLYGLPLESADYQQVCVDSVYIHHGGSLSTLSLIVLFLLLASRLSQGLRDRFKLRR